MPRSTRSSHHFELACELFQNVVPKITELETSITTNTKHLSSHPYSIVAGNAYYNMIGKTVANRLWQNAALCALLAGCVSGCTKIDTFGDIQSTLQAASSNTAVLLCPFFIVNDSITTTTGSTAVSLKEKGVKLICAKTNADDKCIIKGTSRHLEIMGDGITVLGFDFIGSKNGAVAVLKGAGTSFIDCNFLE